MALIPLDPEDEEQPIRVEGGTLVPLPTERPSPQPVEQPEERGFGVPEAAALGARTIFPSVGQVAGPAGGALGGLIGDVTAQLIEIASGSRQDFNPALTASETALGAIPGGKLIKGASRASRALGGAAEGAIFGGGATALTSVAERGELPSLSEVAVGAGLGAGLGAGVGALSTPRAKPKPLGAPEVAPKATPEAPAATRLGPESVGEGPVTPRLPKAEITGEAAELFQPQIKPEVTRTSVEALTTQQGIEAIQQLAPRIAAGEFTKPNEIVSELVQLVQDPRLQQFVEQAQSTEAFGQFLRKGATVGGETLQPYAVFKRFINAQVKAGAIDEDTGHILAQVFSGAEELTKKGPKGIREGVIIPLLNFRRAMLVGQVSVGVRNAIVGVPRNFFEAADQALSSFVRGEGLSGTEFAREAFRSPSARRGAIEAIQTARPDFRAQIDRLLQTPTVAEFPIASLHGAARRLAEITSYLNNKQELAFRRFAFAGTLKARLAAKGVDFATAIANPGQLIDIDDVKQAVHRALDVTFAEDPQGSLGRAYLGVFRSLPELTLINPFPRFQTNALRFIWEHSPAAVLSLLGKNVEGNLRLSDPKAVADALARMTVGSTMLAAGMAFRFSELAGERWYEVHVPEDVPNIGGKIIDLRPFNPLASFAFFAEGLKRMEEGRTLDPIRADFGEAALSLNRAGALGFTAGDFVLGRTGGLNQENLERALGEILGSFTRPLGQVKDFLSVAIPGEAEVADVRAEPFLGEALRNIPFASRALPPARPSLTTGEPRTQPAAVLRQLAGLTVKDRDVVEKALLEADIEPFTLTPRRRVRSREGTEEQRAIERELASLISQRLPGVISSPRFQQADRDERRVILSTETGRLAREARSRGFALLRRDRSGLAETVRAQELSQKPPTRERDIREKERLERLGFGAR